MARANSSRAGPVVCQAAAAAPHASQINSAYASLQIAPDTQPAVPQPDESRRNSLSRSRTPWRRPALAHADRPPDCNRASSAALTARADRRRQVNRRTTASTGAASTPIPGLPPQQLNNPYADRYAAMPPHAVDRAAGHIEFAAAVRQ